MPIPSSPNIALRPQWPLEYRWKSDRLPLKEVVSPVEVLNPVEMAPDYWQTGPVDLPFDFSHHIRQACAHIAEHCPTFYHIKTDKLLFGFTSSRSATGWGLQARVTPLRCEGGALQRLQKGAIYQVQRHFLDHTEMLYLVTFCLPRFLNRPFHDKLVTIFHELYHISPFFDGDLRRHPGRCQIHTQSQKEYDADMAELAKEYLRSRPDPAIIDFLRLTYSQLVNRHKAVVGNAFPRPKLIPIERAI